MAVRMRHKPSRNGDFARLCRANCTADPCHAPNALWNGRVSAHRTYLVLSESMVWKSFSSSSSLSVPSEKKAWNSSRDSFPSSANSNTAAIREQQSEGGKAENQELFTDWKIHTRIISKCFCKTGPQPMQSSQASGWDPAALAGPGADEDDSGYGWTGRWQLIGLLNQSMAQTQRGKTGELHPKTEFKKLWSLLPPLCSIDTGHSLRDIH